MQAFMWNEPTFLENYEEITTQLNLSIREFDLLTCCDGKTSEDNTIYWIEKRVPSANPIKFLVTIMYLDVTEKMTLNPKDEEILQDIYTEYVFEELGLSLRQLIEDHIK